MLDFNSEIKLEIIGSNIKIEDLDIDVKIITTEDPTVNEAEVRIWNLSESTRNILKKSLTGIRILFKDIGKKNFSEIYVGYKRNKIVQEKSGSEKTQRVINSETQGTDVATVIMLAENLIQYRDSFFSRSYAREVTAKDIISDIGTEMGVSIQYLDADVRNFVFKDGISFNEHSKNVLTNLCSKIGCKWSLSSNTLRLSKIEKPSPTPTQFVYSYKLNSSNSETPTLQDNDEVSISTLLIPTLKAGDWIHVDMREVSGLHKVKKCEHNLTNYEGINSTEVIIVPQGSSYRNEEQTDFDIGGITYDWN